MRAKHGLLIAAGMASAASGCTSPTLEDWNRELSRVVEVRSTTTADDGVTATSAVCVTAKAGSSCIEAVMMRDPFTGSRKFLIASGKRSMSGPGLATVTPYVELADQGLPAVKMLTGFDESLDPKLDVVVNGDLVYTSGNGGGFFDPNKEEWEALRGVTAKDLVVVRLRTDDPTRPYLEDAHLLPPDANRKFAAELEGALKVSDALHDALEPVDPEPSRLLAFLKALTAN